MTLSQQRRIIAVSSMVVFTLGFFGAAQKNQLPNARFLIGIGFTYTFISVFADLGAGDFGAGLAILVMISAILFEGEDLINLLTQRAKGKVKPVTKKQVAAKTKAASTLDPLDELGLTGRFNG
jgi:hypothetical protein